MNLKINKFFFEGLIKMLYIVNINNIYFLLKRFENFEQIPQIPRYLITKLHFIY